MNRLTSATTDAATSSSACVKEIYSPFAALSNLLAFISAFMTHTRTHFINLRTLRFIGTKKKVQTHFRYSFILSVMKTRVHRTTHRHILSEEKHMHTHTNTLSKAGLSLAAFWSGALSEVMVDQSPDSFPLLSDWGVLCLGTPHSAY